MKALCGMAGVVLFGASVMSAGVAAAQTSMSFEELAHYSGPDRQQILEEGARQEGRLVWYTSLVLEVVNPIVEEFRAQYPYIDVEYWRGTDLNAGNRVISEFQAGHKEVDVITISGVGPVIVAATGGQTFNSPELEAYPRGELGFSEDGLYATLTQYSRGIAYNTELVEADEVPQQWEDLLDPRWKGKIAFSNSSTVTPMMVGGLIDQWGRDRTIDFIRELGEQDVTVLSSGPAAVLSQVAAGDFDLCYCSIHHVRALQARGAPVDISMIGDTVFAPVQTTQLAAEAPNPHAALLFTDFLLSAEGAQKILLDNAYAPAHPDVGGADPALENKEIWVLTPERMEAGMAEWEQITRENFQ